jgi:nucleoside-diphosphate-sugar epimerase
MRLLITGADQPLGALAARTLRSEHDLRLTGVQPAGPPALDGVPYTAADLREPEQAEPLVDGVEAVLHLAPFHPTPTRDPASEGELLDTAARGTYVLLKAALKAGVKRVVLASRLDLMAAYPTNYRVDETWKPAPTATAASLAPWTAELTLREFVRAENLLGICLRLGELGGGTDGTTPEDAAQAIRRALAMDASGHRYRWWLYHVASTDRYPLGAAEQEPFSFKRGSSAHG